MPTFRSFTRLTLRVTCYVHVMLMWFMGIVLMWVYGCSVVVSLWVFCHCEFVGVLSLWVYGCSVIESLWVFCHCEFMGVLLLRVTCYMLCSVIVSLWVLYLCEFRYGVLPLQIHGCSVIRWNVSRDFLHFFVCSWFELYDQISHQNRNRIRKYFHLFIRGPDGFESCKKLRSKI